MLDGSGVISDPRLVDEDVCDCCQTDVARTSAGPIVVYRDRTGDEVRDIYVTRLVGGEWEPGRPVAEDGWTISGCPVNGPQLSSSGDTVVVAWFTAPEQRPVVYLAFSRDGGESFGDRIRVDEGDPLGRVDVELLEEHLHRLGAGHMGIVLKIENRPAFENLPRILLTALRSPPVGVMVARGDLAVEVGFERLSEVQEEILWLCEAAHVPVIWATQVLEGLAKKGAPSRAEVTDAAMSNRAECAMLNKGPNIVETVSFLRGILSRMDAHQHKRRATWRRPSTTPPA